MPRLNRRPAGVPAPIWVLGALLALVVLYRLAAPGSAAAQHPDPRPGVTAAGIHPPGRYASAPAVASGYEEAAIIPQVLDGLYCHCGCLEHSGHRSLLACFQSDHAVGCDVCLGEAGLAFRMHARGAALSDIRDAVDVMYAP